MSDFSDVQHGDQLLPFQSTGTDPIEILRLAPDGQLTMFGKAVSKDEALRALVGLEDGARHARELLQKSSVQ